MAYPARRSPTGNRFRRTAGPPRSGARGERPLRIGIVLHDFALGGTERIAVRLSDAWAEAGALVTIFCGSTEGPLAALGNPAVAVVAADPPIARGRGSRRRLGRAAAAHWAAHPVDVLFVPGNFHWETVPAALRMPAGVRPAIVAQISASLDKPQRGPLRRIGFALRMRRLLGRTDAMVALFDQARETAERIVGGRARAETIALPALADDVAAPCPPAAGRTIMAAGRLVPEKGFAELIDAFALLDDAVARLVIVGEGPERAALLARADAWGIGDRVLMPGYVADIRPWLDAARLFVLPSHFEGYPAVLVEALAAGRPVVATRCTSAIETLVGADTGTIVPIGDPHALAQAITARLAAPPPDPAALAARVAHHRIGPVAQAYLRLFERATALRAVA